MMLGDFDDVVPIHADSDLESQLVSVPAKWVVYLLANENDQPVQMLAVKNMRASLRRRLSETPTDQLSKRVDYRAIVRKVYYKRVNSSFESDIAYFDLARTIFPQTYPALLPDRKAWFIHVNPDAMFPRFIKTTDLSLRAGELVGPIAEKGHATQLVEMMEDLFDLCRYHNVLQQSPGGSPCAYKDMKKCPAPCDGTVSLSQYRELVRQATNTLINPAQELADQQVRLRLAARALEFELASKIKQFTDQLAKLRHSEYRLLSRIENLRYLAILPGDLKETAQLYAVTPLTVIPLDKVYINLAMTTEYLQQKMPEWMDRIPQMDRSTLDDLAIQRLGVVLPHLMEGVNTSFIHVTDINPSALQQTFKRISKLKPDILSDEEGAIRESQTLS